MHLLNTLKLNNLNILNILIALIPISYIAGNAIINLNIIFLIIFIGIKYKREILTGNYSNIDKLIFLVFVYIFFNGLINNYFNFDYPAADKNFVLKKSSLFLRFFFLYICLKFVVKKNLVDFKYLFFTCSACVVFVSVDVLIQYIFGKDLFGFEGSTRRMGGPFGDEYIAGAYIQKFFIFGIFLPLIIFKNLQKRKLAFLSLSIISLSMIGIILAGNRMPFLMFFLTILMIFVFEKSLRKILFSLFIFGGISFLFLFNTSNQFKTHYILFKNYSLQIVQYVSDRVTGKEIKSSNIYFKKNNVYVKEFETGIVTWKMNKFFGGGVKSFYWNCNSNKQSLAKIFDYKDISCNIHPHNYYLEIIIELGIFGFILILLVFSNLIYLGFKNIFINEKTSSDHRLLFICFFVLFFVEIFPLKTTGSFFTTSNSSFLFLTISFIVGLLERKKNNI